MATNPNFTPQVVPDEESSNKVHERDDEVNATKAYASPVENTAPPEGTPDDSTEPSDSQEHDPNKLGVFRMSNTFLDWVLKHPLPKEKDEKLWKDTLPPGFSPADLKEGTDVPTTGESALPLRRSRAAPLLIVSGLVLLSIGIFATWPNDPGTIGEEREGQESEFELVDKTDKVSTGVQGSEKEDARVPAPLRTRSPTTANGEVPVPPTENEAAPRVVAPPAPAPTKPTLRPAPPNPKPSSAATEADPLSEPPKASPKPTSAPSAPKAFTPEL